MKTGGYDGGSFVRALVWLAGVVAASVALCLLFYLGWLSNTPAAPGPALEFCKARGFSHGWVQEGGIGSCIPGAVVCVVKKVPTGDGGYVVDHTPACYEYVVDRTEYVPQGGLS